MPRFVLERSEGFEVTAKASFEAPALADLLELGEIDWEQRSVSSNDEVLWGVDKAGRKVRLRKEPVAYRDGRS